MQRRKEIAAESRRYLAQKQGTPSDDQSHSPHEADDEPPRARRSSSSPPLPPLPLQIAYDVHPTRMSLPAVHEHLTPEHVLDWFRRTLHIELAPAMHEDETTSDATSTGVPPMSPDAPWWSSLCDRFRDGVLLGQLSSALNAEPLPGLQLHPRGHAGMLHNWTIALNQLRVGGGLSPSARLPSRIPSSPRGGSSSGSTAVPAPSSRGDGIIPFSWLFSPEDCIDCRDNPMVLWSLLAKVYEEYKSLPPRAWAVLPLEDARKQHVGTTRSFVGEHSLYMAPTPTAAKGRGRSRSPARAATASSKPSTPRGTAAATVRSSSIERLSSAAANARERSPFFTSASTVRPPSPGPHLTRRASFDASTSSARSCSPLGPQAAEDLQHLSARIAAAAAAQEQQALSRRLVFQPKSHMRAWYAERGTGVADQEGLIDASKSTAQPRPDQAGLFFEVTQPPLDPTLSPACSPMSLLTDESWPPLRRVSALQEKQLRCWLAQDLGIVVLPSQENAASPLQDPFRNGTVIGEVARRFLQRFAQTTPSGASPAQEEKQPPRTETIPLKRPVALDAVLENTIRSLLGLRRALRLRQAAWSQAAAGNSSPNIEPPQPFATLLLNLSPRLEEVVDQLVKGNNQTLWSLLWYLYCEWNLSGPSANAATAGAETVTRPSGGWSEVELALLSWMQSLGVGVGLGAIDDDSPAADFAAASAVSTAAAGKKHSGSDAVGESKEDERADSRPAGTILPSAGQIGVAHFLALMRKGVLLCDLVLATAASSGGPSVSLHNIARDPRTWSLCRSNISKALSALSVRPHFSMHLFRTALESTVDAVAEGDRAVCFQLLYDIYAQASGLPPHHTAKECMGRHAVDAGAPVSRTPQTAWAAPELAHALSTPRQGSRRSGTPSKKTRALAEYEERISREAAARKQAKAALAREEAAAVSMPVLSSQPPPTPRQAMPESKEPPASDAESSSAAGVDDADSPVWRPPRMVHDALALYDWVHSFGVRALQTRVPNPTAFLSRAELASLPPEHAEHLGYTQDDGASSSSVWSDGTLLCTIVSRLTHRSLPAVSPSARSSSRAANRATALHNIELSFAALQAAGGRMPLRLLYREVARAIAVGDVTAVRELLVEMRTAFRASHRHRHQATLPVQAFATLKRVRG